MLNRIIRAMKMKARTGGRREDSCDQHGLSSQEGTSGGGTSCLATYYALSLWEEEVESYEKKTKNGGINVPYIRMTRYDKSGINCSK